MTRRRWWALLAAVAAIESGCLYGVYWLTTLDVQ